MDELTSLTLAETIKLIKERKSSVEEVVKAYLARIDKYNPTLNAFLSVNKKCQKIPAGIKDVIVTKDITTTAASRILENFIPPYDATVIKRLDEKGIGVIGKTNCDEFAMGSSGENSAYQPSKNPWNKDKVPGGSSSGSAVAVAADLCVFALGSDTGGSIRQPASLCGVVGFKPSYGHVSRYGLIAMASSLDQIGPITKSIEDATLVLEWISGEDKYDANASSENFKVKSGKLKDLRGIKVGVPREYFGEGLDERVEEVVKKAIKKLEELGAEVIEVTLPHTEYAIATYYIIMSSEVSSNLARFDGIRYGGTRDKFGPEAKRRIMLGTFSLSTGYYEDYFAKAAKVRTLIKQDFDEVFDPSAVRSRSGRVGSGCDVIVSPVSPTVAWNLGEKISDPLKMYLSDVYTIPASLAGIPGISVPCGFLDGLPVGLQILGRYMDDQKVLNVGQVYEQATEWHLKKPDLRFTIYE